MKKKSISSYYLKMGTTMGFGAVQKRFAQLIEKSEDPCPANNTFILCLPPKRENCNPCDPCVSCPPPRQCKTSNFCPPRTSCRSCCNPCSVCLDDEENFIESIMPYIRCLSKIKKMHLRVLFQNTIYNSMLDSKHENCHPVFPPYNPSKPICVQDEDEVFYWSLIPHLKSLHPSKRLLARLLFLDDLHRVYSQEVAVS